MVAGSFNVKYRKRVGPFTIVRDEWKDDETTTASRLTIGCGRRCYVSHYRGPVRHSFTPRFYRGYNFYLVTLKHWSFGVPWFLID